MTTSDDLHEAAAGEHLCERDVPVGDAHEPQAELAQVRELWEERVTPLREAGA